LGRAHHDLTVRDRENWQQVRKGYSGSYGRILQIQGAGSRSQRVEGYGEDDDIARGTAWIGPIEDNLPGRGTAGSPVKEAVKLPSLLSGAATFDISMLMFTTICWPMFGIAFDNVADDVAVPV
jgi:hypothetical protein